MKAIILVNGYGTRLRPLTVTRLKPLVEFCNKPMIMHQIEALTDAGVCDIILAVSDASRAELLETEIKMLKPQLNNNREVQINILQSNEYLGTGPLVVARHMLVDSSPFFVLNSDIICDFPLRQLIEYHKRHGGDGTIAVTSVNEPSKYGVVVSNESGKILRFVEKPQEFVGNTISAGIYIFNSTVLDRIRSKSYSLEHDVFPFMATDEVLYAYCISSFWMDIGQPEDFLLGTHLYLRFMRDHSMGSFANGEAISGNVLVDTSVKIGAQCQIGPNVVLGPNVVVEDGVCIKNSTVLKGSVVRAHSWISNCIIGWHCDIGHWTRMDNVCVLGEHVIIKDELYLNGAKVLPYVTVAQTVPHPHTIMKKKQRLLNFD